MEIIPLIEEKNVLAYKMLKWVENMHSKISSEIDKDNTENKDLFTEKMLKLTEKMRDGIIMEIEFKENLGKGLRGRKRKYFTREEVLAATSERARIVYRKTHPGNAGRGRPRKYETKEDARKANIAKAIERYCAKKQSNMLEKQ